MREYLKSKGLTPSEINVASWVITGITNKYIGLQLNIKEQTVKFHITNIFRKFEVKSRAQFIVVVLPMTSYHIPIRDSIQA